MGKEHAEFMSAIMVLSISYSPKVCRIALYLSTRGLMSWKICEIMAVKPEELVSKGGGEGGDESRRCTWEWEWRKTESDRWEL